MHSKPWLWWCGFITFLIAAWFVCLPLGPVFFTAPALNWLRCEIWWWLPALFFYAIWFRLRSWYSGRERTTLIAGLSIVGAAPAVLGILLGVWFLSAAFSSPLMKTLTVGKHNIGIYLRDYFGVLGEDDVDIQEEWTILPGVKFKRRIGGALDQPLVDAWVVDANTFQYVKRATGGYLKTDQLVTYHFCDVTSSRPKSESRVIHCKFTH